MLKRILAVALAIVMVMAMAAVAVSAAEVDNTVGADTEVETTGTSGVIKFNAAGWNNVNQIYCHIWINNGDEFYGWKHPAEKCEKVTGTLWQYDLSNLDASTNIPGGLKSNVDYCVIFFEGDTGAQTYDATFGLACIGDMLIMTGKQIENPIDSNKKGYEANWAVNSANYGPHRAISSVGNLIGSKLCPGEKPLEVVGDWIIKYSGSLFFDPAVELGNILPAFGLKDVTAIMAYVNTQTDAMNKYMSNPEKIQAQLEAGYKNAYGEEVVINEEEVEDKQNQLESGASLEDVSDDKTAATGSSSSSNTGSGSEASGSEASGSEASENDTTTDGNTASGSESGSSSTTNSNVSGTDPDGQNDTILFVLAAIMLVSAGAFVVSRKRTEV